MSELRFNDMTNSLCIFSAASIGLMFACAIQPAHAQTAECSDGSISNSAHFQGTCSHHGGVAVWYDEGMKEEANEWCDENPSSCESSHWEGIEGHGDHTGDADNDDQ
jgi:hypothetical protein